ncbi:MAG: cytosine permease, partial [Chloroflexota bacterium]|nr:cytosine permease [Chloroflexota bacterium]
MASDTIFIPEREQGIEVHGIERIAPIARSHMHIFDNFTLWLSANLVISTVALGALAVPVFGLGFWDSVGAIILFNVLGALPVAFFSTLGPRLGLRQMVISRFSFGWVGAIIMALFNVAACTGWSAVNAIVGGQLVTALSGGTIARPVAVLVIALLTTIVSIYGYKHIHSYARYAWIPIAIIFLIMMVLAGPKVVIIPTPALAVAEVASFISFGGAIYGFATGWSSYAADYNVKLPEETPAGRVFWLTFLGVVLPCIVLEIFGMALTTAYKGSGGDLLVAAVGPLGGFGSVLLVLLALSIVANNIPTAYSLGLSMQVLGKSFQRVSRVIWTLYGALFYMLIAIPAVSNFDATLTDFLLIIAYWLGPWGIILIEEHFLFRRGQYNVDDWNTPGKLPIGWAAMVSTALGLVGIYLGAAQVLFVGPIAARFNP